MFARIRELEAQIRVLRNAIAERDEQTWELRTRELAMMRTALGLSIRGDKKGALVAFERLEDQIAGADMLRWEKVFHFSKIRTQAGLKFEAGGRQSREVAHDARLIDQWRALRDLLESIDRVGSVLPADLDLR